MTPSGAFQSGSNLDNLRVVLVATRNPLNIGAAARAMSNFGASHLRIVNPYEVAFREARSAVGAAHVLDRAQEYGSVAEAVTDCSLVVGTTAAGRRELQLELRRLEAGSRIVLRQLKAGPVALLFGSEKVGLSNEDMSHCHWLMRIPTREGHGSMNLGQAVAVCMYELVRKTAKTSSGKISRQNLLSPADERKTKPKSGEVERLTKLLYDVLYESGYIKPRVARATEEKLRRMLRRLDLSVADTELWLGMLRQIQWKLTKDEDRPVQE
jgi:TrmH family RNA methyltransferase